MQDYIVNHAPADRAELEARTHREAEAAITFSRRMWLPSSWVKTLHPATAYDRDA